LKRLTPQNQRLWRNNVLQTQFQSVARMIVVGRKEIGHTQRQLAHKTAIPRKSLGRWERGRAVPSSEEWRKVAAVLGIRETPFLC